MPARFLPARLLAALLLAAALLVGAPRSAGAQEDDSVVVTINGRGFGHGRGMSQWGAQGYALDFGWSSAQILDHFYSNTDRGDLPLTLAGGMDPDNLRVEIRSSARNGANTDQINAPLRFDIGVGGLAIDDATGATQIDDIPAGSAGEITRVNGQLVLKHKPSGCGGDWNGADVTVVPVDPSVQAIDVRPAEATAGIDGLVRVCHTNGSATWYEGWIRGALVTDNGSGSLRTVNVVSIEQYLRGVVPEEVFTTWEPAALEAQAVAARSYALAGDPRYRAGSITNFADTCDTIRCQVYSGRFNQQPGGAIEQVFADSTDQAIAATAGQVRVFQSNGEVARTEFSASSGGWTVDAEALGGFPAVEDLGDATAANPNRSWSVTVDLTSWVASKGLGALLAIDEVDRTGNGPDGGHVNRVEFVFEDGTISLTGDEVRNSSKFPATLKSRWFTFDDGPDSRAQNRAYVDAVYQLFLQRDPTDAERDAAVTELLSTGNRYALTSALSLSPEWAGVEIDDLYPIVFSRPADAGGRAFWLDQMIAGRQLQSVAAEFYGSPEFFDKVGGTNRAFVSALYREIQQRDPDGGGLTFWSDALDNGELNRTEVAAGFYASIESRERRVAALYQQVLGRGPDTSGRDFWAQQLLTSDDVALAAELAASEEYFQLSQG